MEVHEGENNIFVDITGDDTGVLIGKFGHTLDSIQFLSNVIMTKKYGNRKKILINVGDYRERREKSIHKLARSVARKVLKTRKPEALAPMPPQDRRIIHLALATFDHISTTSEGTGKNRKVIISYKD
jgi:spoIIIJ-associated protein